MANFSNDAWGVTIDSGGGTLRWAAWRGENRFCGGDLPGANPQLLGWAQYIQRLNDTVRLALSKTNTPPDELQVLGMGLSGVDRPDEIKNLYGWVRETFSGVTACWVGNDALPALRAGAGALRGILLIAGTGSICVGIAPNGPEQWTRVRTGGWGSLLGDEGGGYWFGLQLLREACRCADRHSCQTIIERVLRHFAVRQAQQLIPAINQMDVAKQRMAIAGLAPVARELAETGERFASYLIRRGAEELADLAIICVKQLNVACSDISPIDYPLIMHGALLHQWTELAERVRVLISEQLPGAQISLLNQSPLSGSLALAREASFKII